ncbi:MAG: UbiA-like protein EboC [Sphingobacterium sp.]
MGKAWLELIRPSNVLTAISDVLAGVALACLFLQQELPELSVLAILSVASMLLYTGGIVFNDVFDAKLDLMERPERPIPSGKIKRSSAAILGTSAFILGTFICLYINIHTFYIALAIVAMCLLYNRIAKHHFLFGPIVMGLCRGLNLLLGLFVMPQAFSYTYIALLPVIYIAAVTNISRGEVYGNNRTALAVSAVLYSVVIGTLFYYTLMHNNTAALYFIVPFGLMIIIPLIQAFRTPRPEKIRKAVKLGVLALILLNASWVAVSGFWTLAVLTACILPVSIILAKKYAVT